MSNARQFTIGDACVLAGCLALAAGFVLTPQPAPEPFPDFRDMETQARKEAFFDYLEPFIADVNAKAQSDRAALAEVTAEFEEDGELGWLSQRKINAMAERHDIEIEAFDTAEVLTMLDHRIGIVPKSLVLVQAAKESGWGTSRFAREGNNLFGERCYSDDCGLVPLRRSSGNKFWVTRFDSVEESIESYAMNLNTHDRYQDFRLRRKQLRDQQKPITGLDLAEGLDAYSERGDAYIDEIKDLIRHNNLE